jgi:hypothetical protein
LLLLAVDDGHNKRREEEAAGVNRRAAQYMLTVEQLIFGIVTGSPPTLAASATNR